MKQNYKKKYEELNLENNEDSWTKIKATFKGISLKKASKAHIEKIYLKKLGKRLKVES